LHFSGGQSIAIAGVKNVGDALVQLGDLGGSPGQAYQPSFQAVDGSLNRQGAAQNTNWYQTPVRQSINSQYPSFFQYPKGNQYPMANQYPTVNQYPLSNQYPAVGNQYPAVGNQYPHSNQYPAAGNQYPASNNYPTGNQYPANNQYPAVDSQYPASNQYLTGNQFQTASQYPASNQSPGSAQYPTLSEYPGSLKTPGVPGATRTQEPGYIIAYNQKDQPVRELNTCHKLNLIIYYKGYLQPDVKPFII